MTNEMTAIVAAYDAETSIDQTIPIRKRMEALGSLVVTTANVELARENRTALNALLKDAAAPRIRVQRAIKAHPIGKYAFTKSALEREIEAKADALKVGIDAVTKSADTLALAGEKQDWVLIVKGVDLATMNKLVGKLLDDGILAENRGPAFAE